MTCTPFTRSVLEEMIRVVEIKEITIAAKKPTFKKCGTTRGCYLRGYAVRNSNVENAR